MSENSDFYLTLMSNSSFGEFPDNKTSSFNVSLPRNITLSGNDWVVALAEIFYPNTFENIVKANSRLYVEVVLEGPEINAVTQKFSYKVPYGFYNNVSEVLHAFNSEIEKHLKVENFFEYSKAESKVTVNKGPEYIAEYLVSQLENGPLYTSIKTSMKFDDVLALQLGFEPEKCILKNPVKYRPNLELGVNPEMLVYCNLIQPQLFSDTYSQVLRTVTTLDTVNRFGAICKRSYSMRHYMPLLTKDFKTVEINIRSSTGVLMPFAWGNSTVLLHFKRRAR